MHFLTSQRNEVENWLRQYSDPAISHAGSKEKHAIFGRGLKYRIMKYKAKEETKNAPTGKAVTKKAKPGAGGKGRGAAD